MLSRQQNEDPFEKNDEYFYRTSMYSAVIANATRLLVLHVTPQDPTETMEDLEKQQTILRSIFSTAIQVHEDSRMSHNKKEKEKNKNEGKLKKKNKNDQEEKIDKDGKENKEETRSEFFKRYYKEKAERKKNFDVPKKLNKLNEPMEPISFFLIVMFIYMSRYYLSEHADPKNITKDRLRYVLVAAYKMAQDFFQDSPFSLSDCCKIWSCRNVAQALKVRDDFFYSVLKYNDNKDDTEKNKGFSISIEEYNMCRAHLWARDTAIMIQKDDIQALYMLEKRASEARSKSPSLETRPETPSHIPSLPAALSAPSTNEAKSPASPSSGSPVEASVSEENKKLLGTGRQPAQSSPSPQLFLPAPTRPAAQPKTPHPSWRKWFCC